MLFRKLKMRLLLGETQPSHYLTLASDTNKRLPIYSCLILCFHLLSSYSILAQELDQALQDNSADAFSAGENQLSLGGGSSVIADSNYLILQGRYGHFIMDGLMLETGLQAWIPLEDKAPSIYVLSPGITAYLYQLGSLVPYAGAFYQYTMTELALKNRTAIGARGGFLIRQARSHFGLGLRASQGTNCGASCRIVTPEISLFLSF